MSSYNFGLKPGTPATFSFSMNPGHGVTAAYLYASTAVGNPADFIPGAVTVSGDSLNVSLTAAQVDQLIGPYIIVGSNGEILFDGKIHPLTETIPSAKTSPGITNGQTPAWDSTTKRYEPRTLTAGDIAFTPTGTIKATTVQAAIAETDSGGNPAGVVRLKSWTADPAIVVDGQNQALTAGQLRADRLITFAAGPVTEVLINVGAAGATLTAGQNFVALYRASDGALIQAVAADTIFASTGTKRIPLTSFDVTDGQAFFVALLANGTTMPQFARCPTTNGQLVNLTGLTDLAVRAGVAGVGLAAMPATLPALGTGTNTLIWAGLA